MPRREPYSEEFKQQAVARLLAPDAPSVLSLAKELKVSEPTLYNWRKEARARAGPPLPGQAGEERRATAPLIPTQHAGGPPDVTQLLRKLAELEEILRAKDRLIHNLSEALFQANMSRAR